MRSLLIVEDSGPMRRMIRGLVEDLVDAVHECEGGADALAACREHRPEWVLMDIQMEPVDGLAATRQIKAAFPDTKVVMVTNYGDRQMREAASDAGASDYVLKENLLDVRRILARR